MICVPNKNKLLLYLKIKMWVHFDIVCDQETQIRLHRIFRQKIIEWERMRLITGAVLTYHFRKLRSPSDSLYVCLDIPSIIEPKVRTSQLTYETIKQIPHEILNSMRALCNENGIAVTYDEKIPPLNRLRIRDYEYNQRRHVERAKAKGEPYYRGASIEDILKFASKGTKIAIQILTVLEKGENPWNKDKELAIFILSRLREELGDNYPWIHEGFHFVCNPLLVVTEPYLWLLITNQITVEYSSADLYRLLRHARGGHGWGYDSPPL